MQQKALGFSYFFQGWSLITQPGIRKFVIIPLIINVLLFSILTMTAYHYYHILTDWITALLPSWLGWLVTLVWIVFYISLALFFTYAFTLIANVLSAPFNAFLAERVETHLAGGRQTEDIPWYKIGHEIVRTLYREVQKLLYYLPRALFLLICFLIPGINIFAAILWFMFNGWMLAIQYLDYSFDNHKVPFLKMRLVFSQNRRLCWTFGATALLFSMIPLVNLLVMPVSIAGATALWHEHFANDKIRV